MIIHVTNTTPLAVLRRKFSALFPHLKIEFFYECGDPSSKTGTCRIEDNSDTVGDYSNLTHEIKMEIDPGNRVRTLEKRFHEKCGLRVQVLRKSGKVWIETTKTDSWTLSQQNSEGNPGMNDPIEKPDFDFYHEQV